MDIIEVLKRIDLAIYVSILIVMLIFPLWVLISRIIHACHEGE